MSTKSTVVESNNMYCHLGKSWERDPGRKIPEKSRSWFNPGAKKNRDTGTGSRFDTDDVKCVGGFNPIRVVERTSSNNAFGRSTLVVEIVAA